MIVVGKNPFTKLKTLSATKLAGNGEVHQNLGHVTTKDMQTSPLRSGHLDIKGAQYVLKLKMGVKLHITS